MAYDKVVDSAVLEADLTAVADAIRAKGGNTDTLFFPGGFVSAIAAVSTGVELNFEVVAYPNEVDLNTATPAENTIGIVTTNPIKGWYFSATQPENMADGEVWISVGTASSIEFNALKKNGIQVYPISAKQYVNGALVDVTAKSYSGGAWKAWWAGELYVDGVLYGERFDDARNGTISIVDDGIEMRPQAGNDCYIYKRWKLDLSNIKAIHATIKNHTVLAGFKNIIVTKTETDVKYKNETIKAQLNTSGEDTVSLQIPEGSLSGTYYVYIGTESPGYNSPRNMTIKKAWCDID